MFSHGTIRKTIFFKHDPKILPAIRNSVVGIAGAGGLGSNVAVSLARVGVGTLLIADFDKIEPPDLNRQQYFVEQIGKLKVEALFENLQRINPYSEYKIFPVKISDSNVSEIFGKADILVEAFDGADMKKMLIESWLCRFPEKPIIAASGLAGFGKNEIIQIKKSGNLYICGDGESECKEGVSPMAPRVAVVANMQANLALELLLKE